MNAFRLTVIYSTRLVIREWRRFVLPTVSLTITAIVILLMFLLTRGGGVLVSEKAREFMGGDVVIESYTPIDTDAILREVGVAPERTAYMMEFTASLGARERTTPISMHVVDDAYPLYGTLRLARSEYVGLSEQEVLIDAMGAERLGVVAGDTVTFADTTYIVRDIIVEEPTALFGGFRFFPRVIMGTSGFARASVDPALFRINYHTGYAIPDLANDARTALIAYEDQTGVDIDIAGTSRTGFDRSLSIVSEFLVVAVLITAVLGAANVYSSTLSLMRALRRSFAVFLALGMRPRILGGILATTILATVLIGSALGALVGLVLFSEISAVLDARYAINLPLVDPLTYALGTACLILITTVSAVIPALRRLAHVRPREMLVGRDEREYENTPLMTFFIVAFGSLTPLIILASILLDDLLEGAYAILIIVGAYVGIAVLFALLLRTLYQLRGRLSFTVRNILAHKRAEGLYGIVSFTSLFIALTALGTLTLTQVSLTRYLEEDLARTVPTTYLIDVQPSQKDALAMEFPDLTLFQNIGARIIDIDGRRIQELLEANDPETDRELGREYNLTPRRELLTSETIVEGTWGEGMPGEISVDREFAARANIRLGSSVTFLIQGFEVTGTVTSMRDTDSRSGLPFFYFVLSPDDIGQFPSTYFGYAFYGEEDQKRLAAYLQPRMPNVSVIETDTLAPIVRSIVSTLLTLIFLITLPPLLIATLLIATLVVASYPSRRREGARLQSLGAPLRSVRTLYLLETTSLTLFAAVIAYIASVGATYILTTSFLALERPAFFDLKLVLGLGAIIMLVGAIGLYLFMKNPMPLRELLSHDA